MEKFLNALRVDQHPPTEPYNDPSDGGSIWLDNPDLRPTPRKDRTWGFHTYSWFWLAAAANLSNWYSPTSFMSVGLSMWEALACHLGGQFLAGVSMVFTGRPGAVYHVGFPVISRASFGVFGAFWPVINRVIMSIIWNGINVVQGGQCVYVMLHAIFPSIANIPNHMSPTDALTSAGMIGLTVFWFIMCICLLVPIPHLKYFLFSKVLIFFISAIAMLIWMLSLAGGFNSSAVRIKSAPTGSDRSWLICKFVFLSWANCSTFIVNAADFQRYAKKPNDVIFGQAFGFPVANFVVGLVGVIIGTTSLTVFGELVWNPILYLDRILKENYTPANRAGAFFISLCFAYSGLFSCVVENVLPAGNDIAALYPKYLSIKRGFFICALLSLACVPWKLLGTATHFISWLSSYQIFLGAIVGVMLAHYYIVTKGYLAIEPELYSTSKRGVYYYSYGFNWRAYAAYIIGIAPNFYGFLGNLGVKITKAGVRFYYFSFPVGIFVSLMTYWALCVAFPIQLSFPLKESWREPNDYVSVHDLTLPPDNVGMPIFTGEKHRMRPTPSERTKNSEFTVGVSPRRVSSVETRT